MLTYRRNRRASHYYPPPLGPVTDVATGQPGPFRATPATRVLARLLARGESTLSAILDGFGEAEWVAAAGALDGLVAAGRVSRRTAARGRRPGGTGAILVYRIDC